MQNINLANFRDLGGLTTKNGQALKAKRLLRSGEVYQLNQASLDLLRQHQLVKIIDLRGKDEITSRPDDQLSNVAYHWIDIMKDVEEKGSLEDFLDMGDLVAVDQHMLEIYTRLILNPGAQVGYREYFEALLANESGGVLFHCFAGKDRTGIAAALTLALLEVPEALIYEDYLKTNQARQAANQAILAHAASQGMTDEQQQGLKIALEVKASYLRHAQTLMDEHFGGLSGYTKEVLQLKDNDVRLLRQLYL